MGLIHSTDLAAWQDWQDSSRRLRALKGRLLPADPLVTVAHGGESASYVVTIEATHRSVRSAVAEPVRHLPIAETVVICPDSAEVTSLLPAGNWQLQQVRLSQLSEALDQAAPAARAVLGAGHYTEIGRAAYAWSTRHQVAYFVSQHGLLTPHAPPLPPGATLLAWSAEDAEFWWSGRHDGARHVVGSQLLWEAAHVPARLDPSASPVFLGQLHGAELPRRQLARAAETFCLEFGARYRPHPAETDRNSRARHKTWRGLGIGFEESGKSLATLGAPVVSVFSTGLLEARAAGLPAYSYCPEAPEWLEELWRRYELFPYAAPDAPQAPHPTLETSPAASAGEAVEPARRIAQLLLEHP